MASKTGPIIILEDDPDERELLSEVFEVIGVQNEIKYFIEGAALIDYLRHATEQPFIIISDVNLPGLNGLETKRIINQDDALRRKSIPFVFLSTSVQKHAVEEAYNLTAQGFFLKQNKFSDIEKHLRLILHYWAECKHTNSP